MTPLFADSLIKDRNILFIIDNKDRVLLKHDTSVGKYNLIGLQAKGNAGKDLTDLMHYAEFILKRPVTKALELLNCSFLQFPTFSLNNTVYNRKSYILHVEDPDENKLSEKSLHFLSLAEIKSNKFLMEYYGDVISVLEWKKSA